MPRDAHVASTNQGTHGQAYQHSGIGREHAREGTAAGRESVNNGVKSVVGKIEEGTGLKLKAMGWAKEMKEAQSVVSVAQKDIKETVESKSASGDSENSKSLA
ncbi:hypothetical protein DFH29DRAFT_1048624 [Suillus ampliporus]|nr:hypothetical protein DFH29DRAFT_1048624 [Suillus ampliporus]